MVDETGYRPAAAGNAHVQRVDDELGAHVVGHAAAHDPTRVGVLDGGEIQPALPRTQVRHVGDPQHVGLVRTEVAFDEGRRRL
jgi:hypothetical protein